MLSMIVNLVAIVAPLCDEARYLSGIFVLHVTFVLATNCHTGGDVNLNLK